MDAKGKVTRKDRAWIAGLLLARESSVEADVDDLIELGEHIAQWVENGKDVAPFRLYADKACEELRQKHEEQFSDVARALKELFAAKTPASRFRAMERLSRSLKRVQQIADANNASFGIDEAQFGIREAAKSETEPEGTAEATQEPAPNAVAMPVGECLGIARLGPDRFSVAIGSESIDLSGRQLLELKALIQTVIDSSSSAGYIVKAA